MQNSIWLVGETKRRRGWVKKGLERKGDKRQFLKLKIKQMIYVYMFRAHFKLYKCVKICTKHKPKYGLNWICQPSYKSLS